MEISDNKVVSMTYVLKENDGDGVLIQEVTDDKPFVYLFGQGGLLPEFKKHVAGMKAGDVFEFVLEKDKAYGDPQKEYVVAVEKKNFEVDGVIDEKQIKVGEPIAVQDSEGYPLQGVIVEVNDESVVIDFNHPLAGITLYFKGAILDVREATAEELEHGHAHTPDMEH